ncbi:MAG: membrane protein insertase YidC [Bacteroidales bacterium]|nr:membrane protein insertase YidC [Bacteroidales bacterium]
MNKQSLLGFALIGVVLLLFSWYNTKQFEKQKRAQFVQDSLARVEAARYADSLAAAQPELMAADTLSEAQPEAQGQIYRTQSLNDMAFNGEEELVYLENDNVKVGISTHGGQIAEVLIKKYFKYDSTALYLIPKGASSFDVELDAGQYINTTDFNYQLVAVSDQSVTMRLYADADSYIENTYTLMPDSYDVGFDMHFVAMDAIIPRSSSQCKITWTLDMPRLEKGYTNEKNYSAVAFRYSGADKIKQIQLRKDSGRESLAGSVSWVAFKQQFFSAILYATDGFSGGDVAVKTYPEEDPQQRLFAAGASLTADYGAKGADFTRSFEFNFTPNHYPVLKGYDRKYDKLLPLGGWLVGSICKYVIIPVFNWLNKYISSYGLIILLLTILIKLVISPFTIKSYESTAKMKVLQPEIEKINAKYSKEADAMKKQQATMDLYKKSGVSMFGGCLPVLLQFPILYAMFRFFPASFELRQQSFLWAQDLSTYDSILDFGFRIPMYGNHISLFALLMGISMFVYGKMTAGATKAQNQQMPGMQFMTVWMMPIFMVLLCNNFSAGLNYYYFLSNLITIGQNWFIRKYMVSEEKLKAQIAKKTAEAKAPKKSKFAQRLEEAYKMQQQQQKKR